jgi:hypothetical protein
MSWLFFTNTNRDQRPTPKPAQPRQRKSTRPELESLEDRCLLSGGLTLSTPTLASPTFFNKIDGIVAEHTSSIAIQSITLEQQHSGPSTDRPNETLSINFAEVSIHYTQMNNPTPTNPDHEGSSVRAK